MVESKEYIVEGKNTAYKVRFSVYKEGSMAGKILVGIARLGPFFWNMFEHDLYIQPEVAEKRFIELCGKADELAKEGGA